MAQRTLRSVPVMVAIVLTALLAIAAPPGMQAGGEPPQEPAPAPTAAVRLGDATPEESEALNRLATSRAWTSRALAAMRLERFDCEASAGRLLSLTGDSSWRVRAYAFACLARRGVPVATEVLESERDPRVLRATVRGRYAVRRPRSMHASPRSSARAAPRKARSRSRSSQRSAARRTPRSESAWTNSSAS